MRLQGFHATSGRCAWWSSCFFTWVSSLGWCCVLISGRCACWDWCVVLRFLRGLFFPCSSLQLCFPEFVSPKVLQTFLCRCFWKNWFPPVSLLIFSSQFASGLSTAIWLLLSDWSASCTRAFAWVSCFAFYGFFEAFLLRRFSATVFFRGCLSRRFSKRFGADVFSKIFRPQVSLPIYSSKISFPKFPCKCFFFSLFFCQKFFANGFFEAIFPVICLQIFSCFFFPGFLCSCLLQIAAGVSLQMFDSNIFSPGFFLPLIFSEFSVQMFFSKIFFVHKFLCQYIHRRFRSRSFLANVFFFPFFLSRSFSAAVCCKLLPEFLCRCLLAIFFPPVFFPSDFWLIFFRAVFLLVFLQRFFLRKFICMCCFFAYVFCSDVFSGRLLASVFSENVFSTPFCANIFFADVSFQDFFPHTLLFHILFPEYFQGSRFLAQALFFHTSFPDYLWEQQVSCTCFLCCFFQRFSAPVVFEECSPEFLLHCNFFLQKVLCNCFIPVAADVLCKCLISIVFLREFLFST